MIGSAGRARTRGWVDRALVGLLAVVLSSTTPPTASGDEPFRPCRSCHEVGPGAKHGVGPHLDDLFGRRAGSLADFRYSKALVERGEAGLVWDESSLDALLAKPNAFLPGTRMSFRGMPDPAERAVLIAWLREATAAAPAPAPADPRPPRAEMAAAALALEGDPAYGEYLAAECVTCHQLSGRADGIPSIIGWPKEIFVRRLLEYKTNIRSHEVMRTVTTNLGDEEIAALAAFFGSLRLE